MAAQPAPASQAPDADHDQDPRNLHDLAVDVAEDIHKLAVGLAHAGAAPQAVQKLTAMAGLVSQVAKVLANGPVGTAPHAGAQPPAAGASPQAAQPPAAPAAAPQAPAAPAAAPAAPPRPEVALHQAATHLHQQAIAAAQKKPAGY